MPDTPSWSPPWPSPLPPPLLPGGVALYLSGEDGLQATIVNAAAGVTVRLAGRVLALGANRVLPFNTAFVPPTNRTAGSFSVPLAEGWLLDAMLSVSAGSPQHGQTWARLAVVRGSPTAGTEYAQLAHGYVTAHKFLRWPQGTTEAPLDGPGAIRLITGTTPAAGANIAESVPTGARWEVLAFKMQFVTSAVVATRSLFLRFDDGTNEYFTADALFNHVASTTVQYHFAAPLLTPITTHVGGMLAGLPENFRLLAGHRIITSVSSIDAGDQFSNVFYVVREWIAGE